MKKLVSNPENPNGILVDLTAEEISQLEQDNINIQNEKAQAQADEEAKATNQASGNQKLLDLGLTQAEATALTGYSPPVEE